MNGRLFSQILASGEKSHHHHSKYCVVCGLFNASSVTQSIMALSGQTAGNRLYIKLNEIR